MSDKDLDLHFDPESRIPDIVYFPKGEWNPKLTPEQEEKLGGAQWVCNPQKEHEKLCRACGWTVYNETTSSYLPRLQIMHTRHNGGLWNMGNDYMLWDRPSGPAQGNDYITYQFLKKAGVKDIPLVKEMHQFGGSEDQFQFLIMSRAKGVPLEDIWHGLSKREKEGYAAQVIAVIRELRQFTSPVPMRVDGSPLVDHIVAHCHSLMPCKHIGKTKEEWFDGMAEELRIALASRARTIDKSDIEAKLQELKDHFPSHGDGTFVLTHGDLNLSNIIVNNGKIEAIIDWEHAGYYPWWVERWASRTRGLTDASLQLSSMVYGQLEPHISSESFKDTVLSQVRKVNRLWQDCPTNHTEEEGAWLRPAFCKCQPWGGRVYERDWGAELKHSIGTWKRKDEFEQAYGRPVRESNVNP